MASNHYPSRGQILLPLLRTLDDAGGKASPATLYDAVAERLQVPSWLRDLRTMAGAAGEINVWERHVRNARQDAAAKGLIENDPHKRTRNLWEITDKGRQGLRNCKPGIVITVFTTELGTALLADAEAAMGLIADDSIDLILTSPPYPLTTKKEYGNLTPAAHVDWLVSLAALWKQKLAETGSLVLNLADCFTPGSPSISLYQERLLLRLCDDLGFTLAQKFYWENTSKMPSPAEWVCVRRIRVTPSIEQIYWLTKNAAIAKADNRQILRPYSNSMLARLDAGGETATHRQRPSGYTLKQGAFATNNGGSIPHNLIIASNSTSNDQYQSRCRAQNLPIHPARFPQDVPRLFIKFLTEPGDIVYDPLSGSGVTAAVAEELGRRWIISERSLTYLQGAATRFENNRTLQTYFDQIAA